MARKIFDQSQNNITTGLTVQAGHVSQSVDAFTGAEGYDITVSGSLIVTGSLYNNLISESPQASGYKTIVINPTTGEFLTTGSYGGGESNSSGTSGTSGTSGINGTSGTSGTRGTSGTSGTTVN